MDSNGMQLEYEMCMLTDMDVSGKIIHFIRYM